MHPVSFFILQALANGRGSDSQHGGSHGLVAVCPAHRLIYQNAPYLLQFRQLDGKQNLLCGRALMRVAADLTPALGDMCFNAL